MFTSRWASLDSALAWTQCTYRTPSPYQFRRVNGSPPKLHEADDDCFLLTATGPESLPERKVPETTMSIDRPGRANSRLCSCSRQEMISRIWIAPCFDITFPSSSQHSPVFRYHSTAIASNTLGVTAQFPIGYLNRQLDHVCLDTECCWLGLGPQVGLS